MANINKFSPTSPDTFLKQESDMALAKFGHINAIVDAYNTLDTAVTFGMPVEAVTTTQFNKTSDTTLANVTELSVNVIAGATYVFKAYLPVTSPVTPGIKVAMGGTATWTSVNETSYAYTASAIATVNNTTATPGTVLANAAAAYTTIIIEGTVKINAAGTLAVQMAQNTSNGTATSVLVNASLTVTRVS
jgi:hypothetical protein